MRQRASIKCRTPQRCARRGGGFSLLELIVVIGVVGFLVALLLPVLNMSKARAKEVKCAAQLQQVGLAFQLHEITHGYMPLAGWHWDPVNARVNPAGLNDTDARRYTYYHDNGERRPAPTTVALALSLGASVRLDSRAEMEEDMQGDAVRRPFTCPSQELLLTGITQVSSEPWSSPPEWSSYVFNESVLGRGKAERHQSAPMARRARVRRPSTVMLAMDGRPRAQDMDNFLLVPDQGTDTTLLGFRLHCLDPASGKGRQTFDYLRHRWRANVLFVDGHVASVPLSDASLDEVGVSRGVYQ